MKVSIMQPYFFPYIGYFSLIKNTDKFILFDPVQFIRHGWIERNRILKQNDGWLYIQVPLIKSGRDIIIKDIKIDNSQNWKPKIIAQLQPYKKIAPFYYKVVKLITESLNNDYEDIVTLNYHTLKSVCQYLNIEKDFSIFSDMNLSIKQAMSADEWALNTCIQLENITEYWNPPGGESFFDRRKYDNAGINLRFQKVKLKPYDQKRNVFEPGLSIIDVMMFNSAEEINKMLDEYELV